MNRQGEPLIDFRSTQAKTMCVLSNFTVLNLNNQRANAMISSSIFRPLTLLAVLLTVLIGCSKDNTDTPATPTTLAGTWKLTGVTVDPAISGTNDVFPLLNLANNTTCLADVRAAFNADGTSSLNNPTTCQSAAFGPAALGLPGNGRWAVSGNTLTITPTTGPARTFNLTLSGNTANATAQAVALPGFVGTYALTLKLERV
jgi:hypothetical protein